MKVSELVAALTKNCDPESEVFFYASPSVGLICKNERMVIESVAVCELSDTFCFIGEEVRVFMDKAHD